MNTLLNWVMGLRLPRVEHFMEHPIQTQSTVFSQLLASGAQTEYGKQHGFAQIKNQHQFSRQVPVVAYEELFPQIERVMKGEANVLWPGKVKWFAKSSGTTNARSKFIPVSEASLEECHYRGGKDMLALYANRFPETGIYYGKNLSVGGSFEKNHLNPDTITGDVSALIMKNLPLWAELLRAPSLQVALMGEWESKIARMVKETVDQRIVALSGVPTWTLVLLEKILEATGKNNILEVWPNLEVFFHGAVAFGPYRQTFRKLMPSNQMHYMEVYNASEGFFGMQDTDTPNEMLLMLDYGIFYEFIPLAEADQLFPKTVALADVELGRVYAMLISTNAGLWRYKIGDTVRFTSKSPFRIKISGRTKHFINAFGEEVVIEHAEAAITEACRVCGARVSNFTAAPIYLEKGKKGGHEWLIEFEEIPENLSLFTYTLDSYLREINSDYDAKRHKDMALLLPKIHALPPQTFYNWMKKRGKLGGQNKVPRLSNDRIYVDDLLKILYSTSN